MRAPGGVLHLGETQQGDDMSKTYDEIAKTKPNAPLLSGFALAGIF